MKNVYHIRKVVTNKTHDKKQISNLSFLAEGISSFNSYKLFLLKMIKNKHIIENKLNEAIFPINNGLFKDLKRNVKIYVHQVTINDPIKNADGNTKNHFATLIGLSTRIKLFSNRIAPFKKYFIKKYHFAQIRKMNMM